MNANRLVVVLALSVFLGLGSAQADTPMVYDLAAGPGNSKDLSPGSNIELNIRIDVGADATDSGVLCDDGNGDELCGADVLLELTGPGRIVGFSPGPDVIYDETIFPPPPGVDVLVLRSNILPPTPTLGPQVLGILTIDVFSNMSHSNQVKIVAGGQAVDAAGLVTIPELTVALPEPSVLVLLMSGALGLAALQRLRTRSGATVTERDAPQSPK